MSAQNITGHCLCSAVVLTLDQAEQSVAACHCNMCRKWGGGPLLVIDAGDRIRFSGEDSISVYDSSEWAERGFCKHCGTHLFYRLKQNNQHFLPAGLFPLESQYNLEQQIYIDEKPDYYCFANTTRNLTGDELIALFSENPEQPD